MFPDSSSPVHDTSRYPIPPNENRTDRSAPPQGAGGPETSTRVSSAIHLRFDVQASSLPEVLKMPPARAVRFIGLRVDGVVRDHQGAGASELKEMKPRGRALAAGLDEPDRKAVRRDAPSPARRNPAERAASNLRRLDGKAQTQ